MIIGSHVHFNNKQLLGAVKEGISYGANAIMLYTGAPQNTFRSSINKEYTDEAKILMKENNILMENVICHAPYIINLANKEKVESWNFSISFLKNEIKRCEEMGIKYIVLHPGSSVKLSRETGLNNIVEALNYVVNDESKTTILLETMAGKGSECGITIDEIKYIIDNVSSNNIGVCLDTCHLNDSGVNINNFDEYLKEFDKKIGIQKIKCIHINDSKNVVGSHKDRHENIGYGTIGFDTLLKVINNEKLKNVPKILETPYVSKNDNEKELIYPPYKFEIDMIKSGVFNKNLYEDIREYYK